MANSNKFYLFRQNNTGGNYHRDENLGKYVLIEAPSANVANDRGVGLGIYFNGCVDGRDCECCGDRWWPVDDGDAYPDIEAASAHLLGRPVIVHYLDGTVQTHTSSNR